MTSSPSNRTERERRLNKGAFEKPWRVSSAPGSVSQQWDLVRLGKARAGHLAFFPLESPPTPPPHPTCPDPSGLTYMAPTKLWGAQSMEAPGGTQREGGGGQTSCSGSLPAGPPQAVCTPSPKLTPCSSIGSCPTALCQPLHPFIALHLGLL